MLEYVTRLKQKLGRSAILWTVGVLLLLYFSGWLQTIVSTLLLILVVLFSMISGLGLVLCRGKHRQPPAPNPTQSERNVADFLKRVTQAYNKHYYQHRLVISKDLDRTLQEVIDLVIRDFCLSWFRDIGKDETAFVELINKEFWMVIDNLKQRLADVNQLNFLCSDLICVLHNHLHDLRLSDARKFPGQTQPFLLHPCLRDRAAEMRYIRVCADSLLISLLPEADSNCKLMRYIIREVIAGSVLLPTIESVCDPDYINQTIDMYLETREKMTETRKQQYAYAETYEEFIKMINTNDDIETLKQIRYHTIAEIMQATVIHNSKDVSEQDGAAKNSRNKKDALRDRNLKRYINQCRVSKSQCEKRIRQLGGPDYRVYGLGHGQPFQVNRGPAGGKQKKQLTRSKSAKVWPFSDIVDNSLARSFFLAYLQRNKKANLLGFWLDVERLRHLSADIQKEKCSEVFDEYVTPSAIKVIKLESRLVRDMEQFVYGGGEIDAFYNTQKVVYQLMEESLYPEFVLCHEYTEFVVKSQEAMDNRRKEHKEGEPDPMDMSDGFNFKERRNAEALKEAFPPNIEERNDYAVRSLRDLDQKINAKKQALELLKRAFPVNEEEKRKMTGELDRLNTERRHLEFHIERTDLWCEMLGHWKAKIVSVQNQTEDEGSPLFVICVSCDEKDVKQATPSTSGWVVVRTLNDFTNLHNKCREMCTWMSKELPVSFVRQPVPVDNLETLKDSLQEYLDIILGDATLAQSDEVYVFLIPSPDHLRRQSTQSKESQTEKRNPLSLFNSLKGSFQNIPFDILANVEDADEVDAGIEENVSDSKDSIAEPSYALIGELFELKGVFKILRKTLITFVQVTFGGTINRHLREFVGWLLSDPMLIYYIDNFKQSIWPKGILAPYPPARSDLEKLRTREQAKEKMMKNIPDVLQNLVGKRNSRLGFLKLFEAFQDQRTNKHLFYILLELVIVTLCPEIKSARSFLRPEMYTDSEADSPTFSRKHFDYDKYFDD